MPHTAPQISSFQIGSFQPHVAVILSTCCICITVAIIFACPRSPGRQRQSVRLVKNPADGPSLAGFVTFVENILDRAMERGVEVYYEHEAVLLDKDGDIYVVRFGNGKVRYRNLQRSAWVLVSG